MPLNWPQCGVCWLGGGWRRVSQWRPTVHTQHSSPLTATQFLAVGRAPPHLATWMRPITDTHSASQHLSISASQHLSISASQHLIIPASQNSSISASQHLSISASQHLSISASQHPNIPASLVPGQGADRSRCKLPPPSCCNS